MVVPFASVRCLRFLLHLICSTTASSIVRSNAREQPDKIHTSGAGGKGRQHLMYPQHKAGTQFIVQTV